MGFPTRQAVSLSWNGLALVNECREVQICGWTHVKNYRTIKNCGESMLFIELADVV